MYPLVLMEAGRGILRSAFGSCCIVTILGTTCILLTLGWNAIALDGYQTTRYKGKLNAKPVGSVALIVVNEAL